jgi:hypothetical protein
MMDESIESMTLRDYFAAKAITGLLIDAHNSPTQLHNSEMELEDFVATQAYMLADAMMAARKD